MLDLDKYRCLHSRVNMYQGSDAVVTNAYADKCKSYNPAPPGTTVWSDVVSLIPIPYPREHVTGLLVVYASKLTNYIRKVCAFSTLIFVAVTILGCLCFMCS